MTIILDDLTISYRRHPAIHHLSGRFQTGSLTAVIGPNGAGKSTLLKGLAGILRPDSGRIRFQDFTRRDIAYLPQVSALDRSFPITVADLVSLGAWRRSGSFRAITGDRVQQAMTEVGLAGLEHRIIGTLSGGQLQRALFARTMLQDARILLLDEPFTALDTKTTSDLISLISQWHKQGRTIIAVLHDLKLGTQFFPQTLMLAREAIAWGYTAEVMIPQNLRHARHASSVWTDGASA